MKEYSCEMIDLLRHIATDRIKNQTRCYLFLISAKTELTHFVYQYLLYQIIIEYDALLYHGYVTGFCRYSNRSTRRKISQDSQFERPVVREGDLKCLVLMFVMA